jgi:hypothetical protein
MKQYFVCRVCLNENKRCKKPYSEAFFIRNDPLYLFIFAPHFAEVKAARYFSAAKREVIGNLLTNSIDKYLCENKVAFKRFYFLHNQIG